MINVYCVLVKPLYDIRYVERLYNGVKENLNHPFKLHCLTDSVWQTNLPINFIDVTEYQLDTWWNKVAVFDTNISGPGINLYFDLDVKITGNIDFLIEDLEDDTLFVVDTIWKDVDYLLTQRSTKFGDAFYCYGNSSVLGWVGHSQHHLFEKLMNDPFITIKHYGDDTYLNSTAKIKYFDQKICDYHSKESMYLMKDKRVLIHFKDPPE